MIDNFILQGVIPYGAPVQQAARSVLNTYVVGAGASAWHWEFFALMAVAIVVMLWDGFREELDFPWCARILWGYALIEALYILESPMLPYAADNTGFQATAGQNFAEVLLFPIWIYFCPWTDKILRHLKWVMLIDLVLITVPWTGHHGLMWVPSFDNAFAALYFPFAPWWLRLATVASIVHTHGSTAMMVLVAVSAPYLLRRRLTWPIFPILCAAGLAVAKLNSGYLFDGGERLRMWARYMGWWATNPWFVAFGVFPGSFMWTSMMIDRFQNPHAIFMHADWLQIPNELGCVGLVLCLWVYATALWRSWKRGDRDALAALLGLGAFGLTFHPLRWAPTLILSLLILKRGLEKPGPNPFRWSVGDMGGCTK